MDKQLEKLYQDQIKNEWYSAYLYVSMAAYFELENLEGFAHWMKKQAAEEQVHGQKMFEFLLDRGVKIVLQAIPQPPADFASPLEVFEKSLEHEKKVTSLIHAIADMSEKVNDHPSKVFIQWFVTEQVEEEKNASRIVDLLKKIPSGSAGIFQLDHQLSKRE
ncbi:MAG TPA: ferritin [Spirochaetia bacterium]|nr:ferritin [Spirochaetia bacterium]